MDETKMTAMPVNAQTLTELTRILQKYKAGKASIERRTVAAENWWKAAQSGRGEKEKNGGHRRVPGRVRLAAQRDSFKARGRDRSLPEPSILPREGGDKAGGRDTVKDHTGDTGAERV